jgi:Uma2 family endonuclease
VKLPLYARHGIPELWIFNLRRRMFVQYRNPVCDRYVQVLYLDTRGPTGIAALPGVPVDLSSMFY